MSPSLCLNIAHFSSKILQWLWLCLLPVWDYHRSIGYNGDMILLPLESMCYQSCSSVRSPLIQWQWERMAFFVDVLSRNRGFRQEPKRGIKWGEPWSALDAAISLHLDLQIPESRPDSQSWVSWSCVTQCWTLRHKHTGLLKQLLHY